jgi:Spy/CpxP family protein refolding chaperone
MTMDVLRVLTRLAPAAAMVLALTTAATAQPPGGGFGGGRGGFGGPGGGPGGGMGMLLRSDEVRAELELLDDQVEKLQAIEEEMRDKIRQEMGGRMRGGERPDFEAMRATFDEMRKEVETKVGEVLTTQQMDRLRQIETQQQINNGGARSLMGGPLADKLGLTDEQKEQLREKAREVEAKLQEKMAAARAEAREEMLTVLTSEQRATLDELTGTPFTMTEQPQFGRGGDRGDRGDRAERGDRGRRGDREGRPGEGRGRGGRGAGRPAPADDEPEL